MPVEETLRKIGLSKGEIKVYTALLDLGLTSVGRVHEKTGIERRNIYDILNKLIERGLVSYIFEKKKRFYQLTHPNKILSFLEERKHEFETIKKEIKREIPSLIKKYEMKKPKIGAEIYRGPEGLKAILEDVLNYKDTYFIGGGLYIVKRTPSLWRVFNRRRIRLGVRWYSLAREEVRGHPVTKERLFYTRFLPKEFSVNPNVIWIYGNKVANVLWTEDIFVFLIENKEIAENYKKYFEYLWNNVAIR
ncbi:MAG: hypothetical protein HZB67_03210 [Candidatus Aenigmarchaeota archaeon]|nr:hypothetical protein [Candidatus Aenigmarchaeota archaeon]